MNSNSVFALPLTYPLMMHHPSAFSLIFLNTHTKDLPCGQGEELKDVGWSGHWLNWQKWLAWQLKGRKHAIPLEALMSWRRMQNKRRPMEKNRGRLAKYTI